METVIIVRRRRSADRFDDPCLQFPILQAKFYSSELGCLETINATQITSHYGFIPCFYEGKNLVLTISLSRVSPGTFERLLSTDIDKPLVNNMTG